MNLSNVVENHLIIAEDDMDILAVIQRELESLTNLVIQSTNNGNDALTLFKKKNTEFFVTDLNMPGLCGLDLIKEIRNINKDTLIIALSGHPELLEKAGEVEGVITIEKPFDLDDFMEKIHG